MANLTDEERAAILERSFELLHGDATDTRQISEPELSRDELLAEALSRPVDRNAEWAAKRRAEAEVKAEADTAALAASAAREARLVEKKLASMKAEQGERVLSLIEEALGIFDEEVTAPLARQVATLRERILTLEADLKKRGTDVEPIDLPNPFEARRMQ